MKNFEEDFDYGEVEKIMEELKNSNNLVKKMSISKDSFDLLVPSLKLVYKTGLKLFRDCYNNFVSEDFHDWRKFVKHLWYQTTLLKRVWPLCMTSFTSFIFYYLFLLFLLFLLF